MPRIFLSYRQTDTDDSTRLDLDYLDDGLDLTERIPGAESEWMPVGDDTIERIHGFLSGLFGADNIFTDISTVPARVGADVRTVLRDTVATCDIILVIIDPGWINQWRKPGERNPQDDSNNLVWIALDTALNTTQIPTIPVLINNAPAPVSTHLPPTLRRLASNLPLVVRGNPDFTFDMKTLEERIRTIVPEQATRPVTAYNLPPVTAAPAAALSRPPRQGRLIWGCLAVVVVLGVMLAGAFIITNILSNNLVSLTPTQTAVEPTSLVVEASLTPEALPSETPLQEATIAAVEPTPDETPTIEIPSTEAPTVAPTEAVIASPTATDTEQPPIITLVVTQTSSGASIITAFITTLPTDPPFQTATSTPTQTPMSGGAIIGGSTAETVPSTPEAVFTEQAALWFPGQALRVVNPDGAWMRAEPRSSAETLLVLDQGNLVIVVGALFFDGRQNWWPVTSGDGRFTGWIEQFSLANFIPASPTPGGG